MTTERYAARRGEGVRSRFADDPQFAELLREYVATVPEKQAQLQQAHAAGNLELLKIYAHQLKGSGGGYGFDGLSALGESLERACQSERSKEIKDHLDALLGYLDRMEV